MYKVGTTIRLDREIVFHQFPSHLNLTPIVVPAGADLIVGGDGWLYEINRGYKLTPVNKKSIEGYDAEGLAGYITKELFGDTLYDELIDETGLTRDDIYKNIKSALTNIGLGEVD